MSISAALLPEFDQEMKVLRNLLAIVPEADREWAPHPKSYTLGRLSVHLANLPAWIPVSLEQPELDLADPAGWTPPAFTTTAANLAYLDGNVAKARATLTAASDAKFMEPWTLKTGATVHFTLPRVAVVRSFCLNHMIHHRGALSVYLRLRNVPLPNIYGPTADSGVQGSGF